MQIKNADPSASLINQCQGLVRSIAWKIHQKLPTSVDLDDLIGFGQVGLAEAARDFDANRKVQFTTYAYYRVRGAILDGLTTMSWFCKADYSRGRYERSANDLLATSEAGAAADDSGWFQKSTRTLSMTYIMTHWGQDEYGPEPVDTQTPSDNAELSDLCATIRQLLKELPQQERDLLTGIYFEGLSIKDSGERIGVSKPWASRLHARALESLALKMSTEHDF